jgi:hypothetical protein
MELFAQLAAVKYIIMNRRSTSTTRILGYTDNTQVEAAISSLHSQVYANVFMLQRWALWQSEMDLSLRVGYIPGEKNVIADALSRRHFSYVQQLIPNLIIVELTASTLPHLAEPFHQFFLGTSL